MDSEFLLANCTLFHPHTEVGVIPDEVLNEFCCEHGSTFLSAAKLMQQFGTLSLEEGVQSTVKCLNMIQAAGSTNGSHTAKRATFKNCPLVWDTGASFGLTPFRGDFLDYVECKITVRNIAHANTVIGIGTTLHKFNLDGHEIFLPCLSYHLPSAEVQLFSPQTYHTLYGGHSTVCGDKIEMFIDNLKVYVGIDRIGSNVPMVFDCSVLAKEMNDNAPLIQSALPQYERKADFLGGWSSQHYNDWKLASMAVDQEYGHYCCSSGFGLPNVANESNSNLSSAQKELLLWHWKLGISMQRIQGT